MKRLHLTCARQLAALVLLASLPLVTRARAQDAGAETAPASTLEGELSAGAGAGRREVRLPTRGGERRLDSSLFPALDLGVRGEAVLSEQVLLGARFRYRTSVGLLAEETPDLGATRSTPLRAHHVELGVVPALRFTASRDSVALGLLAGWIVRGLRAVVDTTLPPYTLHGPVLRLELRVPIAGDRVRLRLSPELFVPISISDELHDAAALDGSGLALGAEASVGIRLSDAFAIDVCYRESHASVPTDSGTPFTDIEQFATVQVLLRY